MCCCVHVADFCKLLHSVAVEGIDVILRTVGYVCCSVLQCVCCSVLQSLAVGVLQSLAVGGIDVILKAIGYVCLRA